MSADFDLTALTEFKLEIAASSPKTLLLGPHKYTIVNTGVYDDAGTPTANAVAVFFCDSAITLAKDYGSADADDRGSIPVASGASMAVRGGRTIRVEPLSGAVTVVVLQGDAI